MFQVCFGSHLYDAADCCDICVPAMQPREMGTCLCAWTPRGQWACYRTVGSLSSECSAMSVWVSSNWNLDFLLQTQLCYLLNSELTWLLFLFRTIDNSNLLGNRTSCFPGLWRVSFLFQTVYKHEAFSFPAERECWNFLLQIHGSSKCIQACTKFLECLETRGPGVQLACC